MSTFRKLQTDRLLCLALAIIAILRAVFIFFPVPQFWGISFFAFLPDELAVALSVLSIVAIVWASMDKGGAENPSAQRFNIFSLKSRIVISICAGVLFFLCAIPFALLGDGGLFLADLYRYVLLGQAVPLYREPLTMLLNSRVYALIYPLQDIKDISVAYHVTGALFGMLYIGTALKIASQIRAPYFMRVCSFVLIAACGGVLLFFGYVENYAPQYAMVLLYLALVLHMFRAHGSPVWPGIVLVLCCLFHLQNVLLIPSFAVALGMRRAETKGRGKQFGTGVYKYGLSAAPILLLVYAFFQWRPLAPLSTGDNPFIPFMKVNGMSYTLLSPMHLMDIMWEHFLLAPVAITLLVVVLVTARRLIRWTSPEMIFLIMAAIALEAFLIGGNLLNGIARDWDVVASLGSMLTLIAIVALEQVVPAVMLRRRTMLAVCIVALSGTIGWVALNVDADAAIVRYKTLLVYHRPEVTPTVSRYGYESLRKVYFKRKDWVNEIATDATMLEILPWHVDLDRMLLIARRHSLDSGTTIDSIVGRILQQLVKTERDSTLRSEVAGDEGTVRIASPGAFPASLGDLIVNGCFDMKQQYHVWSEETAEAFADTLIALHRGLPYGYELRASLRFIVDKDTGAAIALFRQSAALDNHRANPLVAIAMLYQAGGKADSVRAVSMRALSRDNGNFDAAVMLFGSMSGLHLSAQDVPDLKLLEAWAQTFLQRAKDRESPGYQIDKANSILSKTQSAIAQLQENKYAPAQ